MADYPDYTDLMQIIGSDIMIPMDIQAAYIMMPVDIQAQYVDLDINIKSQEVTINIDIDAQSVGIYLQADWSAKEGTDKNFTATATNQARGGSTHGEYTVPGTKTLFICGLSFYNYSYAAADGDLNQMGQATIYNYTDSILLGTVGGNGGGSVVFSKPIPLAANKVLWYEAYNFANHATNIGVTAWGFEI